VASVFSHAVAALGIGACFYRPVIPNRVFVIGAVCSVVPDLDVIGFRFGVRYADFWGHCGFTHSLLFAALLASAAAIATPNSSFRTEVRNLSSSVGRLPAIRRVSLWTYFFLATASHGFLDAMTDGGLGVAFFSPFDNRRYFLPWTQIRVSPIGLTRFFTHRGLALFQTEVLWIWLPAALLAASAWLFRRSTSSPRGDLRRS
jgi:inner membrane protein